MRTQNRYSGMQIMTVTIRTPYVHVVLNCVTFFILFHIRHALSNCQVFSKYDLITTFCNLIRVIC